MDYDKFQDLYERLTKAESEVKRLGGENYIGELTPTVDDLSRLVMGVINVQGKVREELGEAKITIKILLSLLCEANAYSMHPTECTLKPPPWDTPCNCWKSKASKLEEENSKVSG